MLFTWKFLSCSKCNCRGIIFNEVNSLFLGGTHFIHLNNYLKHLFMYSIFLFNSTLINSKFFHLFGPKPNETKLNQLQFLTKMGSIPMVNTLCIAQNSQSHHMPPTTSSLFPFPFGWYSTTLKSNRHPFCHNYIIVEIKVAEQKLW